LGIGEHLRNFGIFVFQFELQLLFEFELAVLIFGLYFFVFVAEVEQFVLVLVTDTQLLFMGILELFGYCGELFFVFKGHVGHFVHFYFG
jgi:hypothetical protein